MYFREHPALVADYPSAFLNRSVAQTYMGAGEWVSYKAVVSDSNEHIEYALQKRKKRDKMIFSVMLIYDYVWVSIWTENEGKARTKNIKPLKISCITREQSPERRSWLFYEVEMAALDRKKRLICMCFLVYYWEQQHFISVFMHRRPREKETLLSLSASGCIGRASSP